MSVGSVVVTDNVEGEGGDGRLVGGSDSSVGAVDGKAGQGDGGGNGLATGRSVDISNASDDIGGAEGGNDVDDGTGGNLVGLGQSCNGGLAVDDLLIGAGGNGARPVVNDTVESSVSGLGEDYILLPVGGSAGGTGKLLCQYGLVFCYTSKNNKTQSHLRA